MQLAEYTTLIKNYCNSTKSGFFKLCKLLSELNKSKKYKEKYNTFEEYIQQEGFEFTSRHAYNYIKIWDTFGTKLLPGDANFVKLFQKVKITELLQISNIPDREIRDELVESAVKGEVTKEQITQAKSLKVEDSPRLNIKEEHKFKLLREHELFNHEIKRILNEIKQLFEQYKLWDIKANEFKSLKTIKLTLKSLWTDFKIEIGRFI